MLSCYLFLLNNMAQRKLLNAIKQNIDMSPSPIEAKKKNKKKIEHKIVILSFSFEMDPNAYKFVTSNSSSKCEKAFIA
jgi:hypothetical protein